MKFSMKKAELNVDGNITEGVLLLVEKSADEKEDIEGYCTDYIPDQLFVALDSDPSFYSNNYTEVDEMMGSYDQNVRSVYDDYISRSYLEKDSGLYVNFFQPSQHFDGDPVYVTVTKTPTYSKSSDN
jgi:hypothetical protein